MPASASSEPSLELVRRTSSGRPADSSQQKLRHTSILVVEDDASSRLLMSRVLEGAGYRVMVAADGEAGLAAVAVEVPDVVVIDVGLPGINGLEVCARLRAEPRHATLPILMLTARAQLDGLGAGADDYLAKPFRQPELLARIRSALRLRAALLRMETAHAVVAALANAVEAKDPSTEHHCQRLAFLSALLTERIGLDHAAAETIAYGALLHDVGKIGIPEAILTKPGPLDDDEWGVMRRHPEIGERICVPLGSGIGCLPIIRHHHERWDGRGYPDRLAGEMIPLGARIVAVADAFDAMTHDRHYRAARTADQALEEIHTGAGSQFDPELARLFVQAVEGGGLDRAAKENATLPVPLAVS